MGTLGPGIVFSAAGVLGMGVVRGMRGAGGVCMCTLSISASYRVCVYGKPRLVCV